MALRGAQSRPVLLRLAGTPPARAGLQSCAVAGLGAFFKTSAAGRKPGGKAGV